MWGVSFVTVIKFNCECAILKHTNSDKCCVCHDTSKENIKKHTSVLGFLSWVIYEYNSIIFLLDFVNTVLRPQMCVLHIKQVHEVKYPTSPN